MDMMEESWVANLIPTSDQVRFPYSRPDFVYLCTEDEIQVSADQMVRPIIVAKEPLKMPLYAGYAECINAGKSVQNEDQSTAKILQVLAKRTSMDDELSCSTPALSRRNNQFPEGSGSCTNDTNGELYDSYFEAIEVAHEAGINLDDDLHHSDADDDILTVASDNTEKLSNLLDLILQLDRQETILGYRPSKNTPDQLAVTTMAGKRLTRDSLVIGAMETAFAEMDKQIEEEKMFWKIPGGCAAIVCLCFLQRLYIANAGDCRAVIYLNSDTIVMSKDHTPDVERKRLQYIAYLHPQIACRHFSRLEYSRRLSRKDLRKRVLFRDWYMEGWSQKSVRESDLRPTVVSDTPGKSRLLSTIGVCRGFGDHHLATIEQSVPIKPFLSCVPEVNVYDLVSNDLTETDVIVLASDGLWDVLSNTEVGLIVKNTLNSYPEDDFTKYTLAAQDLVIAARGVQNERGHWKILQSECVNSPTLERQESLPNRPASSDDISVFVIPLKHALAPPVGDGDCEMLQ